MPIILDDLQTLQVKTKSYVPKFFDKELTGSGKKTGILSENQNPVFVAALKAPKKSTIAHMKHMHVTNGNTTSFQIPLAIITPKMLGNMFTRGIPVNIPNTNEMVKAGTTKFGIGNTGTVDLYFRMTPVHIGVEKTRNVPPPGSSASISISRTVCTRYLLEMYFISDPTNPLATLEKCTNIITDPMFVAQGQNLCMYLVTEEPHKAVYDMALNMPRATIDSVALNDYFNNYELYTAVCRCSEEWQADIASVLDNTFQNFENYIKNGGSDADVLLAELLRYLENYNVPLDLYRDIYASLVKHFPNTAGQLCKQNMNLLLSNTLNALNNNKANLTAIPANTAAGIAAMSKRRFSPEQQRAIASQSPLSLVQAGAGTGKSTVILGRIDWLIAEGVQPSDIMVLSFTNAAADHIKELNPDVHSMTIAKMIHSIYAANYPDHELSTLETLINSLEIYFPTDPTARKLGMLCRDISKNAQFSYTIINNFIEDNFDEVINLLNEMKQTSLELEIMICYQQIENLIEPPDVQSKYLIIDEVQDNSVFEFIYTLKYVAKHNEALFIVGDCSQTLYEFRASDPRALNVLEGSGVFDAYQLQVNYRSNQEILDFANVSLANIEANQYANIQLRANSLQQVTEQSFTDKVKLKYYRLRHTTDLKAMVPTIVGRDLRNYIDSCLGRGEQVALLAFQRNTVAQFGNEIANVWPDAVIANLVPSVPKDNTILSKFIRDHWDEVQFMPTHNITDIIIRACLDSMANDYSFKKMTLPAQSRYQQQTTDILLEWQKQTAADLTAMQTAYGNGSVTLDEFMNTVKRSLLDFEIQRNTIRQALISQRNRETKLMNAAKDANFVLSTIHSAKGLEFDNVIVIYDNRKLDQEDAKRMYYVALTRAMHSEFIVAYDMVAKPAIETAYKNIVDTLNRVAPKRTDNAAVRAKRILDDYEAGKLKTSLDGFPSYEMALPAKNLSPIVYSNQHMAAVNMDNLALLQPEILTRIENLDMLIQSAREILDAANTRGVVITEEEMEEAEAEENQAS